MGRSPDAYPGKTSRSEPLNERQAMSTLLAEHDAGEYDNEVLWQALFRLVDSGRVHAADLWNILHTEWLHREHISDDQ